MEGRLQGGLCQTRVSGTSRRTRTYDTSEGAIFGTVVVWVTRKPGGRWAAQSGAVPEPGNSAGSDQPISHLPFNCSGNADSVDKANGKSGEEKKNLLEV